MISIHALRVEGDYRMALSYHTFCKFLSTPSGWRATCSRGSSPADLSQFLSTPSGWRATRDHKHDRVCCEISIHALRVEGDMTQAYSPNKPCISIHALRVEGDRLLKQAGRFFVFISIHALRVEGDLHEPLGVKHVTIISIHALRVEGDLPEVLALLVTLFLFLSTPSGWRAT